MTTAHDNHMFTIDNAEDGLVSAATNELKTLVDDLNQAEVECRNRRRRCFRLQLSRLLKQAKRNRARVSEICKFYDYHAEDLERIRDEV